MSRVLIDQLRALARRLANPAIAGRHDSTRKFWLVARQLRASLPPLVLPLRGGARAVRIGYLIGGNIEARNELGSIAHEHSVADEHVTFYMLGDSTPGTPEIAAPTSIRRVDASRLNEMQLARLIAEDDLDILVDADGGILQAMPLLIALHPARRLIEPLFVPATSGAVFAATQEIPSDKGLPGLLSLVRTAIDALPATAESEGLDSPARLNATLNGGIQMHQAGHLAAARSAYEDVLARYPRHPIAAYLLGQLSFQQGDRGEAIRHLQDAVAAAPEFRDAHYTLAQRLLESQRWHEAIAAYRRALELTPGFAAAWSGLGLATLQLHESAARAAIDYLQRAVSLEPDNALWSFNLGSGLQRLGDMAGARDAYERATRLDPGSHEAHFNLGAVAQDCGELANAIQHYRAALERQPAFASAYVQLGACLLQAGRIDEWLANYDRYRSECPESLAMAVYGLEASVAQGDPAAYDRWRDRIIEGALAAADAEDSVRSWEQLLFLLLHVDVDRAQLLQCYRRYDEEARAWYGVPLEPIRVRRPGPLRIGYLSGDLRDHVMGRMIHSLVSEHDRARYQPYLYALNSTDDEWTARFRALGFPFVPLAGLSHALAAARVREDDLDVLVDCSGHTAGAQQGILALKPARVIATHIATPGPVGLRTVDYKLTDAYAESHDAQQFLIERLWPVPAGIFPWHRYPQAAKLDGNAASVPANAFVYGTFVSLMKLSPRCLGLWRRILERLPQARLAFSPPVKAWEPAYRRWLQAHGIGPERVLFVPYAKAESDSLARYAVVDVVLDPLPCGNVNGTMEALAMGVPVVTLVGQRHGERLGNALLNRFGVTDTIAFDADAYVDIACRFSEDPDWAHGVRERIRVAALDSPVWNGRALTQGLEAALEQMATSPERCAAD